MPFPPDPPTPRILTEPMPSADGGVNTRAVAWNLQPNQFDDGYNIDVSQLGVWKRRKGVESLGGGVNALPGGFTYHRTADGDIRFYGIWGSDLYRSTGGGGWTRRASNASYYSNVLHQFVEGIYNAGGFAANQFRAVYIGQCVPNSGTTEVSRLSVFRGDNPSTDNTYTQNESYAPRALAFFQGRLWKANDQIAGDGNDLAWSELDDGLTYSPANELSIEPGVGGKIVALFPLRSGAPRLIVFKEEAIAYLEPRWGSSSALIPGAGDELDTLTSRVEPLTVGVGCIATRSLAAAPGFSDGDVLFLSRDGVRSLARAADDTLSGVGGRISENIPRWIDRINFSAAHKATATVFDNAYHLAVPLDGAQENTHVLRLQLETGAWTLHNWPPRDVLQIPQANQDRFFFQHNSAFTEESTLTGLPDDPIYHLYRGYNGDLDPGATYINYELVTRAFVFQNPKIEKVWDRAFFLGTTDAGETHHMRVAYRVDFQNWVTQASEVVFGVPGAGIVQGVTPLSWDAPDQKMIQRRIGLRDAEPGTMLQIRFSGSRDEAQPQIYYFDVTAFPHQEIFDNSR